MGVIDNRMAIRRLRDSTAAAVADLQDQIDNLDPGSAVTSTNITADCETPPEGVTIEYALLDTYGKLCILSFMLAAAAGSTATDTFTVYTIPETLHGTTNYMSNNVNCDLTGEGDEQIIEAAPPAAGEYVTYSVIWLVGDPAPEPTPGE